MKYFLNEKQRKESHSTCYYEFQRGKYDGICWKEDSISISDDDFTRLKLGKIFLKAVPEFDYYGITEVNIGQWEKVKLLLREKSGEYEDLLKESEAWFEDNFKEFEVFTICGM